eukprot:scaffold5962_cov103-Isochrysis_galbana.AAC.1
MGPQGVECALQLPGGCRSHHLVAQHLARRLQPGVVLRRQDESLFPRRRPQLNRSAHRRPAHGLPLLLQIGPLLFYIRVRLGQSRQL